jgi:hypothetical protein
MSGILKIKSKYGLPAIFNVFLICPAIFFIFFSLSFLLNLIFPISKKRVENLIYIISEISLVGFLIYYISYIEYLNIVIFSKTDVTLDFIILLGIAILILIMLHFVLYLLFKEK